MENLGYGVKHKRGQMKPSRRYHRRLTANIVAIWPCQLDALPIQRLCQIADLMGEKHAGLFGSGGKQRIPPGCQEDTGNGLGQGGSDIHLPTRQLPGFTCLCLPWLPAVPPSPGTLTCIAAEHQ